MTTSTLQATHLEAVLDAVYAWSRAQNYRGYDKHDALNSPVLSALLGWAKWPRLLAIQTVMRLPFDVRSSLGVPKVYNPKGLALFAQGLLDRYQYNGDPRHLQEAEQLLSILLDLHSPGRWAGPCWGYAYPWQDLGFFAPAHTPNAVVTSFVCETLLDAYEITGRNSYLDTVVSATNFFTHNLTVLKDNDDELCLSYMPLRMSMRVMDVSILIGAVLARCDRLCGKSTHRDTAYRLVNYVVRRQTSEGAWFYTDPPYDSPIRHDNYHTGFILDSLHRFHTTVGEQTFSTAYDIGLKFYAAKLFNQDGSPRWMSDCDYPHDVHGAAQGILTFSRHAERFPDLAEHIALWALEHLYCPEGRFYYQQTARDKKRFTFLRWCNGWMVRALAHLLRERFSV